MDKAALRKVLRARRAAIEPAQRQQWEEIICDQVFAWWMSQVSGYDHGDRIEHVKGGVIGVYSALPGEPDLSSAYRRMAALEAQLALPVVLEKHAPLAFAQWAPGEEMIKDSMGVAVPAQLRLTERPALIIVPCLGFNGTGFRLGYGGGYYDRTLAAAPRPKALGVAYSCQRAEFETGLHDIALDQIVTELKP